MKLGRLRKLAAVFLTGVFAFAAALPAMAEDDAPGEAGIVALNPSIDMGEITEADLAAMKHEQYPQFEVVNYTGERLSNLKVSYYDPDSGDYQIKETQSQVFSGTHFYVVVPEFIDASGELQKGRLRVKPYLVGDKKVAPREEPYVDQFRLEADTKDGSAVTVDMEISITVTQSDAKTYLQRISAIQGEGSSLCTFYAYLNESLIDVTDVERNDFEIKATDEDGTAVYLDEDVENSFERNPRDNSIRFHFKAIETGDQAKVINLEVTYLPENQTVTTSFTIEPNSFKSNIPEDGKPVIRVVDSDENPISGARVTLVNLSAGGEASNTTGADGYAKFVNALSPAQYALHVEKEGFITIDMKEPDMTRELTVIMGRDSDLEDGEASEITILVKDQDGAPVDDATVRFYCAANNGRGALQTDVSGKGIFRLTANSYEIVASKSGHFTSDSRVLTVSHKKEYLEIVLERRYMCHVTTTVLDENGRPVSGAKVYYECPTDNDVGTSYTNKDGRTGQVSIRANDYILTVSKAGYDTLEKKVRVHEEDEKLTVALTRAKAVEDDDDDEDEKGDSAVNSPSGGSSGNYQGSGSSVTTGGNQNLVGTEKQVIASEVNKELTEAIKKQVETGGVASAEVRVKNAASISADALKSMRLTADSANAKAKLLADTVGPDGKIEARLYIDPAKSYWVDQDIKLGVSLDEKDTMKTQATFDKYFDNQVSVVHFEQQGAFGMEIDVAVKADLKDLNKDSLVFYSYDAAANKYTQLPPSKYYIDENGFLHLTTSVGGDLVITDKPLAKK